MGHNVQKAVRGNFLAGVMGTPSPASADTRSSRRGREDLAIRKYNEMINNLKALKIKIGLGDGISTSEWSNKRTYDALTNALAGYDMNRTIQVIESEIIHDANEIQRLQGIYGGSNYDIGDLVSTVKVLNRTMAEKTAYLNQYKTGQIFVDVADIVEKIQNSNNLKREIESEKQRILLEDEKSEEYQINQLNEIANVGIDQYNIYKSERAESELQYTEWLAEQQLIKEQNEKERLESVVTTEDITIPTTEPTVIPHNDEETEYIDDITPETIPVKKIGAGILALGAIGVLLALRFKS